jgi:hypothetical protein
MNYLIVIAAIIISSVTNAQSKIVALFIGIKL